jgi:hypothetical protein
VISSTRRATAYVLVLASALIVVAVGVAAVAVSRAHLASTAAQADMHAARAAAIGGIKYGIANADGSLSWRTLRSTAPEVASFRSGSTNVSTTVSDPVDATLDDDWSDPIQLTASASLRNASQTIAARFSPVFRNITGLNAAIAADGDIILSAAELDAIGIVASGGSISNTGQSQYATRWSAKGTITGTGYNGTLSPGSSSPELPSAETITYLKSIGTRITYASTGGILDNVVLSESINPYGATNPNGVYYIECGRSHFYLRNSRIRGTLLILEPGATCRLEGSLLIEPLLPNLPALVIDGATTFATSTADLSESARNTNFNPTGAPYLGATDNDKSDLYPSMLAGVVWINGNLTVNASGTACEGALLVSGNLTVYDTLVVRAKAPDAPIPGFGVVSRWSIDRSSIKRIVD